MAEQIRKNWDISLLITVGLILAIIGLSAMLFAPKVALGQATTVVVTANVQEYLTFTSSATSVTLTPDLLDNSGVLGIGSSTDITLTLNTSSADGYSIDVKGSSDLGLQSGGNNISMTGVTTTAATGTDSFGLQAVSSDMTVQGFYDFATSTNDIGRASTTDDQLATDATPASGEEIFIRFVAACDAGQPAGVYTETITFTALATP
ncbi:hypothetical protein ACFLYY_00710 [Patescibacteria group bacterium]